MIGEFAIAFPGQVKTLSNFHSGNVWQFQEAIDQLSKIHGFLGTIKVS